MFVFEVLKKKRREQCHHRLDQSEKAPTETQFSDVFFLRKKEWQGTFLFFPPLKNCEKKEKNGDNGKGPAAFVCVWLFPIRNKNKPKINKDTTRR